MDESKLVDLGERVEASGYRPAPMFEGWEPPPGQMLRLKKRELKVLRYFLYLCAEFNSHCCWPSQIKIAQRVGLSSARQVQRILPRLANQGVVVIDTHGAGGESNLYTPTALGWAIGAKLWGYSPRESAAQSAAPSAAQSDAQLSPGMSPGMSPPPYKREKQECNTNNSSSTTDAVGAALEKAIERFPSIAAQLRKDPQLSIAAIARLDKQRWRNPPGALCAILESPESYGLERDDNGAWRPKQQPLGRGQQHRVPLVNNVAGAIEQRSADDQSEDELRRAWAEAPAELKKEIIAEVTKHPRWAEMQRYTARFVGPGHTFFDHACRQEFRRRGNQR